MNWVTQMNVSLVPVSQDTQCGGGYTKDFGHWVGMSQRKAQVAVGERRGAILHSVGVGACSGNLPFCGHCVQRLREGVSGNIQALLVSLLAPLTITRKACCDLVLAQGVPRLTFTRASHQPFA